MSSASPLKPRRSSKVTKPSADSRTDTIGSMSFQSLLFTQLLTSINDNVFRWLVVGIGKDYVDQSQVGWVLAMGLGCFVLPYIVFASIAGWLADRFSKRDVIIACKFAEIAIMSLGVLAIVWGHLWFLFVVVAMMGAQSALFAPAKMGTIPELLSAEKMSVANGWFGFSTVTATILGMGIGLWLSDFTGFRGQENLWVSVVVLVGLAGIGTVISFGIRRVPPANPTRHFPWNTVACTMRDLATLYRNRALFMVACGIVFFWTLGAMAQLNIDQFANESGAFAQSERIPLLISLVLGVGVGSVLAGIWSGGRIELGMLSASSFGIALFSMLLFTVNNDVFNQGSWLNWPLVAATSLLCCLGICAGIFDVPLAAYIQHRSPVESRGAMLSAANFMIYTGILLSALFFYVLRLPYHPGSLDNVSPTLAQRDLNEDQLLEIDRRLNRFETDWQAYRQSRASLTEAPEESPADDASNAPDNEDVNATSASGSTTDDSIAGGSDESTPNGSPSASEGAPEIEENSEIERPQFTDYLPEDQPQIRNWLLAKLMWKEIELRREDGESVPKLGYLALCEPNQPLRREDRMLVKTVYEQSTQLPLFSARQVFLVIGLIALPIFGFITWKLPQASARFVIWWFLQAWFRVRIHGLDHLPDRSPFIILCNHNSWFHRLLVLLVTARRVREVTWETESSKAFKRSWHRFWGVIHISGGPTRIQQATAEARKTIRSGNVLAVFPEQYVENGETKRGFSPQLMTLAEGIHIPLVPLFMERLPFIEKAQGRSPLAIIRGIIFGYRKHIDLCFAEPQEKPRTVEEVRRMLVKVGTMTDPHSSGPQSHPFVAPVRNFIRQAKHRKSRWKMGDSTGAKLNGGALLMRALIGRRLFRKHVLGDDEPFVGVLVPPSVPGAVTNLALALDRRVAVNLNYTASEDVMNSCIEQCGIKHVLTSEKVISKLGFKPKAELIMLESLREKVSLGDKMHGAMGAFVSSASSLERKLQLDKIQPDDLLTVIFTSGSTGLPKGVMLTQSNIASNISSFNRVLQFSEADTIVGILPFFHSFGYTVSLWGAMVLDIGAAYHFNPLDAKQVGKLCHTFKGTCLLSTPTFLRSYTRRCSKEDLQTLEIVVTGAEKLPEDVVDAFEAKFNVRPVEGYGTSELAPVACVNVPPGRSNQEGVTDCKPGTVGRPLPDVEVKVVDLDSNELLGPNKAGMIWIKGPNVMKGYLKREELTKEVLQDGWYKTGDVGFVDDEGFVTITGRISRFSKIGGEMVPHVPLEEELNRILGSEDEGLIKAAVTSLPDPKKGERLIVVHTKTDFAPAEMVKALQKAGLAPICIPSADAFIEIAEIPVLGTGKMDLRGVKQVAEENYASAK